MKTPSARLHLTRDTLRQMSRDDLRFAAGGVTDGGIATRGCTESCAGNCAIDFTRLQRNTEP